MPSSLRSCGLIFIRRVLGDKVHAEKKRRTRRLSNFRSCGLRLCNHDLRQSRAIFCKAAFFKPCRDFLLRQTDSGAFVLLRASSMSIGSSPKLVAISAQAASTASAAAHPSSARCCQLGATVSESIGGKALAVWEPRCPSRLCSCLPCSPSSHGACAGPAGRFPLDARH